MQLRGLSERTQETYLRAVRQLAERFAVSPDQLSEEEIRYWFFVTFDDIRLDYGFTARPAENSKPVFRH